jgi:3D (Asp-Asp-Asp) domain-containing protein
MRTPLALVVLVASACTQESPRDASPGLDGSPDFLRPDSAAPDDSIKPHDVPTGPYVRILQPLDGATVKNPVTFTIEAKEVAKVRIFADAWPLSEAWDPKTKTQLTYSFAGLDFKRKIDLEGHDATGVKLASHSIQITVSNTSGTSKGQLVGTMWNTYYFLARETDYTGAADTPLNDASCKPIATVSAAFSDSVCVEGSGLLADGRVINYASTCSCGRPCPTGGTICYKVLDKFKFPWGMGAANNPLTPLRSFAVDKTLIPIGTVLYAEQWDGVSIPAVDGIGGFKHDGCFLADDVGGAITGLHYDFYAGTKTMWQALEKIFPTKSNFTVFKDGDRCAHLRSP